MIAPPMCPFSLIFSHFLCMISFSNSPGLMDGGLLYNKMHSIGIDRHNNVEPWAAPLFGCLADPLTCVGSICRFNLPALKCSVTCAFETLSDRLLVIESGSDVPLPVRGAWPNRRRGCPNLRWYRWQWAVFNVWILLRCVHCKFAGNLLLLVVGPF